MSVKMSLLNIIMLHVDTIYVACEGLKNAKIHITDYKKSKMIFLNRI